MKKQLMILCLLFIVLSKPLTAQSDFQPGFVVELKGDTIYGEIAYMGDKAMSKECVFRYDGVIHKYFPTDIKSYCLSNKKYFISKKIDNKSVFLEYLVQGRLNVYYIQDGAGTHYYVEKEGLGIEELPYKEEIRKRDNNKEYRYKSRDHIAILTKYTFDVPDPASFQNELKNMEKPEHKNLISFAKKYHKETCPDELCIVFQQKPKLRIDFEIVGGISNYKEVVFDDQPIGGTYFTTGLQAYVWLPREGNDIYFRTGIIFSYVRTFNWDGYSYIDNNGVYHVTQGNKKIYCKIPIALEYVYTKHKLIHPKIGLGLNFHQFKRFGLGPSAGVNIRLSEKIYVSANYEIDFLLKPFPKKICTQSFYGGVRYHF